MAFSIVLCQSVDSDVDVIKEDGKQDAKRNVRAHNQERGEASKIIDRINIYNEGRKKEKNIIMQSKSSKKSEAGATHYMVTGVPLP